MENKIIIEQLTVFSPEDAEAIKRLAQTLGKNYLKLTDEDVKDMLTSSSTNILVAREEKGKIVGMLTLLIYRIPYTKKSYLDDLVVDEGYRGLGIGTRLLEKSLEIAREKGAIYVDLTASPERIAGNRLYEKLGFKKRETNVYRLVFDYAEV